MRDGLISPCESQQHECENQTDLSLAYLVIHVVSLPEKLTHTDLPISHLSKASDMSLLVMKRVYRTLSEGANTLFPFQDEDFLLKLELSIIAIVQL